MNASPLSAYPGNWSKLAHPGESRTTSPGLASSVALSTAFSRSGVLWTTSLEALVFEVGGDAWTRLTLAYDRPAHSEARQHLREIRVLLRATEDQHYGHVEALQGRRHRGRVGSLGIVHVGHARHLCRYPHAVRLGLVFEQRLPDLPEVRTQPLCGGRREERVLVVVRPREAQLGHVCQMRAAEE